MGAVTLEIPTPLREFTDGATEVQVHGATVRQALDDLYGAYPQLGQRILSPEGELRPFVNLFYGDDDVRSLSGLDTPLPDRPTTLTVLPAVAGGARLARDQRLEALRSSIPQVDVSDAHAMQQSGACIVDVREPDEIASGSPPGAVRIGRSYLEMEIEKQVPSGDTPLLVLCSGGQRSLFAAEDLQRLGYTAVHSIEGGLSAWKNAGLPVEVPDREAPLDRERYARHLRIPEVGEAGQRRLGAATVGIVGAGGLGCPAALYLAAAGVGTLRIIDADRVERSNLQRQVLHADSRIGRPKVESAAAGLHQLNPDVRVDGITERVTADNARALLEGCDVVVDGSDNFTTRYAVNDACVALGIPDVFGAVYRFEGQTSVLWPGGGGPCYRCLHAEPPPPELAPSCSDAGVLGLLPGVIGLVQATEAVKLILAIGEPLTGRILHYDALAGRFRTLRLAPNPECAACGERAGVMESANSVADSG